MTTSIGAQPPQISVIEVTGKKEIKSLRKQVKKWEEIAAARAVLAKKSPQLKDPQKELLAYDSLQMTSVVKSNLKPKLIEKNERIFAAYNSDEKLQGVAIALLPKKGHKKLEALLVDPENLPIIGYEEAVRGTGTALVTEVASTALGIKTGCKKLHLDSLPSAKPFYEKLGFKRDKKHPAAEGLKAMVLTNKKMRELISNQK